MMNIRISVLTHVAMNKKCLKINSQQMMILFDQLHERFPPLPLNKWNSISQSNPVLPLLGPPLHSSIDMPLWSVPWFGRPPLASVPLVPRMFEDGEVVKLLQKKSYPRNGYDFMENKDNQDASLYVLHLLLCECYLPEDNYHGNDEDDDDYVDEDDDLI